MLPDLATRLKYETFNGEFRLKALWSSRLKVGKVVFGGEFDKEEFEEILEDYGNILFIC